MNQNIKLIILAILTSPVILQAEGCGSNNIICYSDTIYQICYNISGNVILAGSNGTCATGTTCSETGEWACVTTTATTTLSTTTSETTTTAATTATSGITTATPTTAATTSVTTTTAATTSVATTTAATTSVTTTTAATTAAVTTTSPTTTVVTTTVVPTTLSSDCEALGAGNFPTSLCYEYLKCVRALWWYGSSLVNCDSGFAFNATSQACEASTTCTQ